MFHNIIFKQFIRCCFHGIMSYNLNIAILWSSCYPVSDLIQTFFNSNLFNVIDSDRYLRWFRSLHHCWVSTFVALWFVIWFSLTYNIFLIFRGVCCYIRFKLFFSWLIWCFLLILTSSTSITRWCLFLFFWFSLLLNNFFAFLTTLLTYNITRTNFFWWIQKRFSLTLFLT